MSGVQHPDDLLGQIAELQRRVRALETAPRLTSSSIKEGTLSILDANNKTRVQLGKIGSSYGIKVFDTSGRAIIDITDPNGLLKVLDSSGNDRVHLGRIGSNYGIQVKDANAVVLLEVTNQGFVQPQLLYDLRRWILLADDAIAAQVTGSSYGIIFLSQFRKQTPKFSLQFRWSTSDGSTKGRIRIVEGGSSTVLFESAELGPNTSGAVLQVLEETLSGVSMGDSVLFQVEAKRTAGSGTFRVAIETPLVSSQ